MLLWFRDLPDVQLDDRKWRPFIQNHWFRIHYMKLVYMLMLGIYLMTYILYETGFIQVINHTFYFCIKKSVALIVITYAYKLSLVLMIFILHELLHIIVIYGLGDISLTHKGIYFWLTSEAKLTKYRFWLFMTLPLLILSILPWLVSIMMHGYVKAIIQYIGWINLIIASSDLINSLLILIKPNKSWFYRGYYYVDDT